MKQFCTLIVLVLLLAVAAVAATPDLATVTITHKFFVGKTEMPAGEYTIRCDVNKSMAILTSKDGHTVSAIVNQIPLKAKVASSYLVFMKDNGKLVLHQVALAGDDHIHDILHDKTVAELK